VKRRDGKEEHRWIKLEIEGKWCGGGRGWCSPFIGVGGVKEAITGAVTAGVMAFKPLMAREGYEGFKGGIQGRVE
jgi:hypothetical protein